MVNVTNRPYIHVRLTALEFLLGHFPSPSSPACRGQESSICDCNSATH
jgi:hypothetical protein